MISVVDTENLIVASNVDLDELSGKVVPGHSIEVVDMTLVVHSINSSVMSNRDVGEESGTLASVVDLTSNINIGRKIFAGMIT